MMKCFPGCLLQNHPGVRIFNLFVLTIHALIMLMGGIICGKTLTLNPLTDIALIRKMENPDPFRSGLNMLLKIG